MVWRQVRKMLWDTVAAVLHGLDTLRLLVLAHRE
jgi:hypothetical protein